MTSINGLPDEVLVSIFSRLSLEERHRSAALACRRWRQLCTSAPQLLRCIGASFEGSQRGVDRLQAFCAWLVQHGAGRVERLSLQVFEAEESFDARYAAEQQAAAALSTALAACGAAGSLTALRLAGLLGQTGMWAGAMRGLRQLWIDAASLDVQSWASPPGCLATLEELCASGRIEVAPFMPLPANLTKLYLYCGNQLSTTPLPRKLSTLTRLHALYLNFAEEGLSTLAHLSPSLRHLSLVNSHWPACLSQLTGLESLYLDYHDPPGAPQAAAASAAAAVAAALHGPSGPRLQQLTRLALDWLPGEPAPQAELAALRSLQNFVWLSYSQDIPPGPWLARLQSLMACVGPLARLAPALPAAAPNLEFLGVQCDAGSKEQLGAVLRCIPRLPALRRAAMEGSTAHFSLSLQPLMDAQRAAPHVAFHFFDRLSMSGSDSFLRACGHETIPDMSEQAFFSAQ